MALSVAGIRSDPLVRNSFFLMATTGTMAVLGFGFWLVVARLFPVEQVGQATTLLSALALLSYFSMVGMDSTLVRRLPTSARRPELVSTALVTIGLAAAVVSMAFGLIAPLVSPELGFVSDSWVSLGIFVVLAVFAALNLATNSVFVALRSARWNLLINGLLMGLTKLALPFLFVWGGALGIYSASGVASGLAAVASVWAIRRRLQIRLSWTISRTVLRETFRYSLGTYVSGALNLAPQLVIPILVLAHLGPVVAAAYFMAFQIVTVINSISFAVGESLFAEGSHAEEGLRALMTRSALLMAVVTTPAVGVVVLLAGPALSIFGPTYAETATMALVVLAVSSFAVAFHTWASFLLKITDRLSALNVAEGVFAVVTIVLVLVAADVGPAWIAAAWGAGNLAAGAVATLAFLITRRSARTADSTRRSVE